MRDSPFRLRIGKKEENDPTAISVSGDGLHSGETGQKCEFIINTCNAGSGLLQVQIDGPSKVTLDAYEVWRLARIVLSLFLRQYPWFQSEDIVGSCQENGRDMWPFA